MNAGTPQTRKVYYLRKTLEWVPTRKTEKYRGWNKYLDVRMTQTPLLRFVPSRPTCDNGGPNWFNHLLGEYGIAQNFQILYCDFEAA